MESTIEKSLWNVAEIQLTYKSNVKASLRPKIACSRDAFNILKDSWDWLQDRICWAVQSNANKSSSKSPWYSGDISTGGVSGTVADPKVIFAAAIKAGASGFIMAHNHPSGNLSPSQSDIDLTRKMKEGGKLLEVQLLDHIIVTTEGYYSFADEGMIQILQ